MLAYFPTEQLYYLRVHDIIPAAITLPVLGKTVALNTKKLLLASSRLYLTYIVLEFFRLKEQSGLLYTKEKALSKTNVNSAEANAEKAKLKRSWTAHTLATAYNTFRFPGALHWYVNLSIRPFFYSFCVGRICYIGPSTLNIDPPEACLGRQAAIVRAVLYKFNPLAFWPHGCRHAFHCTLAYLGPSVCPYRGRFSFMGEESTIYGIRKSF